MMVTFWSTCHRKWHHTVKSQTGQVWKLTLPLPCMWLWAQSPTTWILGSSLLTRSLLLSLSFRLFSAQQPEIQFKCKPDRASLMAWPPMSLRVKVKVLMCTVPCVLGWPLVFSLQPQLVLPMFVLLQPHWPQTHPGNPPSWAFTTAVVSVWIAPSLDVCVGRSFMSCRSLHKCCLLSETVLT